jgi:hypothetical protein
VNVNKLHSLLADLSKGKMHVMRRAVLEDKDATADRLRRIRRLAKGAVCFDFGDADALTDISPNSFVRLPYPTIWAEFDPVVRNDENSPKWENPPRAGVLMHESEDAMVVEGVYFFFRDGHWIMEGSVKATRSGFGVNDWESFEKYPDADDGYTVGVVLKACAVMKCTNVQIIENKPSAVAKMRAAKKRLPIFSTWTLHIRPDAKQSRDLGGTHAPPRVHLRRGHIRQYRPGLFTWVQPCVVGRKERGVIHKDYSMTTGATA